MFTTPMQRLVSASAILLIISGCSHNPRNIPEAGGGKTVYDHNKRKTQTSRQYVNRYQKAFLKAHHAGQSKPMIQLAGYSPQQRARIQQPSLQQTRLQHTTNSSHTAWRQVHQDFRFANYNHKSRVRRYVKAYARMPERMQELSHRAGPYLPTIMQEIRRRNMPSEIALLPFVESAYNTRAYSPAKAAGMWQFIPATARRYGLRVNRHHDERYNWRSSTNAALNYLQDLNRRFDGDWLLTLAAYNCGEARVEREIARNRARGLPTDYWNLRLPRETRNYVPRLLAFKEIYGNPQGHGMQLANIPHNPRFGSTQYKPSSVGYARVARNKPARKVITHKVRSGDTLYRISKRYGTSVKKIMRMNGLKSTKINTGERLIVAKRKSSPSYG